MQLTDQLGRVITLTTPPVRIVSLVPSITELLWHLGLEEEVVGITKFCVRPAEWFENKPRIGGTKTVHLDKLRELQPDLVIANKEENDEAQVREIAAQVPTWVSDVRTIESATEMISMLGELLNRPVQATGLVQGIEASLGKIAGLSQKRAAYLVWNEPTMLAGRDTFISFMMEALGFKNVIQNERYPELSDASIAALQPEVLLLPSEPFPFAEKHLSSFSKRFPSTPAILVDGEIFSWYGSRMLHAAAYATELHRAL